jgi:2-polyprenyl-6-hydroxyphenyl methylase/3-demethylubiquinone-9 3-methyltransferase
MTHTPFATELHDLERALGRWPEVRSNVPILIGRLSAYVAIPPGARVLDVGAAQGLYVAALHEAGFSAVGVEPSAHARRISRLVSERLGQTVDIVDGTAEQLPFADGRFHLVLANSVMEHTTDPAQAADEALRVLRPGGGFYFSTTSALCPRQAEIRGFPAFPWYPDALKKRVMRWAAASRPALVGYARTPAYHWFTPRRVMELRREAGFSVAYDRWDVRGEEGMGSLSTALFRTIRSRTTLRRVGEVLLEGSSYLFVK